MACLCPPCPLPRDLLLSHVLHALTLHLELVSLTISADVCVLPLVPCCCGPRLPYCRTVFVPVLVRLSFPLGHLAPLPFSRAFVLLSLSPFPLPFLCCSICCVARVLFARAAPAGMRSGRESPDHDAAVCYICFDDSSETGNELVPSPCSCKKPVHRQCLSKWISTKGSRLCSICKSKLPIDCTVEAPYVVLQVVRHMRGLHWSGEREYIISFNQRPTNFVTIGFGADCDLCLPDPSLSRTHSRIEYKDGGFQVEDLTSSAGTFLKLTTPHRLPVGAVSMFKMGRTMLTVKVERRKLGVLQSWRASRKKRGDGASVDSPSSRASMEGGEGGGAASGSGSGGDGDTGRRRVIGELSLGSPMSGDDSPRLSGSPVVRTAAGGAGRSGSSRHNDTLDLPEDVIAVEEYDDGGEDDAAEGKQCCCLGLRHVASHACV
jgi:hypothetical protein